MRVLGQKNAQKPKQKNSAFAHSTNNIEVAIAQDTKNSNDEDEDKDEEGDGLCGVCNDPGSIMSNTCPAGQFEGVMPCMEYFNNDRAISCYIKITRLGFDKVFNTFNWNRQYNIIVLNWIFCQKIVLFMLTTYFGAKVNRLW